MARRTAREGSDLDAGQSEDWIPQKWVRLNILSVNCRARPKPPALYEQAKRRTESETTTQCSAKEAPATLWQASVEAGRAEECGYPEAEG